MLPFLFHLIACSFTASPRPCEEPHLYYAPDASGDVYFGCAPPAGWLDLPPDEAQFASTVTRNAPADADADTDADSDADADADADTDTGYWKPPSFTGDTSMPPETGLDTGFEDTGYGDTGFDTGFEDTGYDTGLEDTGFDSGDTGIEDGDTGFEAPVDTAVGDTGLVGFEDTADTGIVE